MKYNCCDFLLHDIVFSQDKILPCCCSPNSKYGTVFLTNYSGQNFNFDEYLKQRAEYIEIFKNGKIPEYCRGCFSIKNDEWNDEPKIKRIIITNRTKCSCNCIYCSLVTTSTQTKEELNTRVTYDITPVLTDLRNKNLISKDCVITVAGGECCEYPKGELEHILYIAASSECRLEILSSGIIYSKAIENALKTEKCNLIISVDSGYRQTYEKIKRVKSFERVWENLKKYISAASKNQNSRVTVKYIILPEINDNKKEAAEFARKCKEINCKNIEIAIEYIWLEQNKTKDIPQNIKETYEIIKNSGCEISFEGQVIEYFQKSGLS